MDKKHKIQTFLFCCFLFFTAPVWGQLEDKIVVSKVYTFHTGDDSVWAQPDYDDSHWERIDKGFPRDRWQGIGWFRFVVEVDSSLWNVPLGLSMLYAGAVEFYVDGKRLQQFGTVGMSEETEIPNVTMGHPSLRIISFLKLSGGAVEGKSRHIVAFRYSTFLLKSPVWSGAKPGWDFNIGDLEQMRSHRDQYRRRVTIHQMLLMGIFLAFALLHLLLFAFYPKQRDNLYFAGLTASVALTVYFWFQVYFVRDATQVLWAIRLQFIAFIPYMLSLIRFTYSLIYARRPRAFIVFCLLGSALAVWCWLRPILAVPYVWVFSIAAHVEVVRALVVAWFRKRELFIEGGWIILLGTVPLLVTGIYSLLGALGIAPELWDFYDFPTSFYAVLLLIISMSIFLARNFAHTSKTLEAKLVEVTELSEKTLQQELERTRLEHDLELEHIHAEKLEEIDRMKSRFFANISHEFRTPLTLILGPLEKLLSEKFQEPVKKQFRVMLRNGRRLLRLINQLLDLSKLEAGSMRLKTRPENLVQLLKGIVLSFSSLAERKRITLKLDAPEEAVTVYVDRDKLEKIMANLLSNAFKFTPEGGAVNVECGVWNSELDSAFPIPHSEFVQIQLTDTGVGIPQDRIPHIFDRFYQADDSYTREPAPLDKERTTRRELHDYTYPTGQEGSGIGLALTKELVELHHGEIQVASEVGKGAAFTVRLPLGKNHLRPEEIVAEAPLLEEESREVDTPSSEEIGEGVAVGKPSEGSESPPLLLIVEDNADVRTYIRDYLEKDYEIMEAVDGEEGFEKSVDAVPDLIISDVMMPKMDGYELCQKLKTDERTSHIPVILLTARAGGESKVEGLETGADDYIIKPFDARELQVRIKNLIEQRRKLRERFAREITVQPKDITITSMDEQFLQKAMDAVEQNLSDPEFSTDLFAKRVAMSRMQLHRKLRALTDHSAHGFIRAYRLKRAAQLLQHQAGTITEICYDVGFNSLSHFSKAFREQFGQSPSEFAHKHSQEES